MNLPLHSWSFRSRMNQGRPSKKPLRSQREKRPWGVFYPSQASKEQTIRVLRLLHLFLLLMVVFLLNGLDQTGHRSFKSADNFHGYWDLSLYSELFHGLLVFSGPVKTFRIQKSKLKTTMTRISTISWDQPEVNCKLRTKLTLMAWYCGIAEKVPPCSLVILSVCFLVLFLAILVVPSFPSSTHTANQWGNTGTAKAQKQAHCFSSSIPWPETHLDGVFSLPPSLSLFSYKCYH